MVCQNPRCGSHSRPPSGPLAAIFPRRFLKVYRLENKASPFFFSPGGEENFPPDRNRKSRQEAARIARFLGTAAQEIYRLLGFAKPQAHGMSWRRASKKGKISFGRIWSGSAVIAEIENNQEEGERGRVLWGRKSSGAEREARLLVRQALLRSPYWSGRPKTTLAQQVNSFYPGG